MSAYPIPESALDDRLAFIGTSGAGKIYSAGTAIEKLLASKAKVVIVDPLGIWWGLRLNANGKSRGFDLPIFGGEADYIRGFNMQKNARDRSERFAGMETYAAEFDEQRKTKGSEDDGRDTSIGVPAQKTESA